MIPRSDLAFDIWQHITTILANEIYGNWIPPENIEALKALSLTRRNMVQLCQKHLFSTLLLNDDPGRSARFRSLLSDNPDLILYVRGLDYLIYDPFNVDEHEILHILLDRSLILRSISLGFSPQRWDQLPSSLQALLEQLIQIPTVTELQFMSLDLIPSQIIGGCTNLTHLTLRNTSLSISQIASDDVEDAHRSLALCPRLVYFEGGELCDGAIELLMRPLSPTNNQGIVDISGLKKLVMYYDGTSSLKGTCKLLQNTTALESLHLSTSEPLQFAGLGAALLTHTIPSLKQLLVFPRIYNDNDNFITGLVTELSKIAGSNVLETISLQVVFTEGVIWRMDGEDWRAFDSLLTTSGSFPKLKLVSIEVSWYTTVGGDSEAEILDRITEKRFPKLSRSDALEFRFSVENDDLL